MRSTSARSGSLKISCAKPGHSCAVRAAGGAAAANAALPPGATQRSAPAHISSVGTRQRGEIRLLRARLGAAYTPQQHLGGALFWFLRGIDGPQAGLCHLTLPTALLDALDAMLDPAENAA